jgi:curved DNA-binding protein CbpA
MRYGMFTTKPKTAYEILGVGNGATPTEMKMAYFKLVKVYHPDHNKDASAEVD